MKPAIFVICFAVIALTGGVVALTSFDANAGDGIADQNPTTLSPTPAKDENAAEPQSLPNSVEGKTNNLGKFYFDVKHGAKVKASGLHIRLITPEGSKYKISWVQRQTPLNGASGNDPDNPRELFTDAADAESDTYDVGEEMALGIKLEKKKADGTYEIVENEKIKLGIWLTRDATDNTVISAYSPSRAGGVELSSTTIPGANLGTQVVVGDNDEIALTPIHLGEGEDYRFGNGTLVLAPDQGCCRFEIPEAGDENFPALSIHAYDTLGNVVCDHARISTYNPRIDDEGNFLIDVWRSPDASESLVLVIEGLKLRGATTAVNETEYTATMSGAPLKGYTINSGFTLVEVIPE